MQSTYKGLSNLGATCYMNSLLQTLFMTVQFRDIVYKWKYDKNIHPKQSDSILYQLQKLFAKLELNYPHSISTKQLAKSFQWEQQDAHAQQDIQQFNRVLFEALQKSLVKNHLQIAQILKDSFEGSMIHYTKCLVCGYESVRQQVFQDLILTIKNIHQKIYNKNVEIAFQRYMKPQRLDENNMVECQACEVKVLVERGVRFLKMPNLLNIILQRFTFDIFTYQRQKINDYVEFPFVLNFNRYMQDYDLIPDKLNEDSTEYFAQQNVPLPKKTFHPIKKTTRTAVKKPNQPSIAGKIKTKPLPQTKSFLKDIRSKRNVKQQQNQDIIYVNGSDKFNQDSSISFNEQSNSQINQIKTSLNQSKQLINQSKQPINQSKQSKESNIVGLGIMLPPPPPPPPLTQPYKIIQEKSRTIQQQFQAYVKEKSVINQQKQQKLKEIEAANNQLIQKYLKDGPLVYELYAVLVHNGSATHGHYYSYIKSFEDAKWYCFNDQKVSQVSVVEISKAFGGNGSSSNAYAIYYRLCKYPLKKIQRKMLVPTYIKRIVEEEMSQIKMLQNQRIMNIDNLMILKIHYQLYVKQLQIYKTQSLEVCMEKVKEMFGLKNGQIKETNLRLRMYNPISDMKLDTYTGRQALSLEELNINSYKSLLLQCKNDNEVFEQFQIGFMSIRIALWQQNKNNLVSLDESHLKLHKVSVNRYGTIKSLQQAVQKSIKQIQNKEQIGDLILVKRHINDEHSYHQVINTHQNNDKTLDDLGVFENQVIFVENLTNVIQWGRQFENQLYRINVKYNLPAQETQLYSILTDSRRTLSQLKEDICNQLGSQSESIIIRRGNKSGIELKNTSLTLKQLKFINGSQLYLQNGIAAKQGEIRVHLYMASDAPIQSVNKLHQFKFIADIPICSTHKASQVKEVFSKWYQKLNGINLNINDFRIRQKVSDKMGKIYRQKPMKEQQLIEKRQISIQLKQDTIELKQFEIYVRYWDVENWVLSEKKSFIVNRNTSMIELGQLIQSVFKVQVDKINICRVLSIHKFTMLDLVEMEYFAIHDVLVVGEPLFVNSDGLLYIVKDVSKELRNLSEEEEKRFGGTLRVVVKSAKYIPKKEKGITIKVIEKQENQNQQKDVVNQN